MKGSGVFTLRSFHASSGPPPDLNAFTCPNCSNKVDKDRTYDVKYKHILPYFKGNEGVPAIFLEYYPKISVSDFRLIKKDAQFLERKARVCDACYIDFTQVSQSGSRAKNQISPKLSRSLSSTGNGNTITLSDKFSNGSGSPPSSPLFTNSPKAPPIFKSSPPPARSHNLSSSLNSTSTSSSTSSSPSISPTSSPSHTFPSSHTNHSLPPSHTNHSVPALSKRVQKNGNYKDSYYLSLYEELDSLRKELHDIKSQEESSADQFTKQLKEKDEELRAQKKVQANKLRQETHHKDEQIKELQTTIANMQRDHASALEAIEREFEKKLEHKIGTLEQKQGQLEATVAKLKQEKEDLIKQSEAKIDTDRNAVLAEVEKLKQKFDMEKVVEKEQLRTKFKEDLEISKKKSEERTLALKQQVTDLETQVEKEKREKEKALEEKQELTRQLELLKAKNRAEGKA